MKLPTLYSRTTKGAIQEWTIEVGDGLPFYRTIHGQKDGKLITSEWFTCEATNVGRANERSGHEQAIFIAESLWKKKKEKKYFENLDEIDNKEFQEPMLAKNWDDRKDTVVYPVYCQPKLDGMRAIITRDGARSRNNKEWLTIPHILEQLKPLFEANPDLILDGELYTHDLKDDFDKISSLIKKKKPTPADLAESAQAVQFWWYDIANSKQTFEVRNIQIQRYVDCYAMPSVVYVPTYICYSQNDLDRYYEEFVDQGYEGQMIRFNTPYEFKRSANLLKRKEFQDDDYKIILVGEGNGNRTGVAGYMTLEREDGVQFNSNIKGNRELLRKLLTQADELVGKYATVKFFNLTPDGIPRFPYVIKIREGKGID